MTSRKQTPSLNDPEEAPGVVADRPITPGPDYGVPKSELGLLPWSHVSERMAGAKVYWVATVDPEQRPHVTPVDGLWLNGHLYFSGDPSTKRNRNLATNPAICVHLENGMDVVILHGDAYELRDHERSLAARLSEASNQKYGYGMMPEDSEKYTGGVYVFRPQTVFAWKEFPKDVTRWRIP